MRTLPRPFVLASTSPYRRALLERLGVAFEIASPQVDEEVLKRDLRDPEALVLALAREKARSLAARFPEALILGSDQAVDLDGEVLGKPGTPEAAVRQLLRLAGREHRLLTAVALHDARSGETRDHTDVHVVRLRSITEAEARDYVLRDRPLECAGAYRVESLGIALVESLRGEDYTAVIGLPLMAVVSLLAAAGSPVLG